jgi:AdoMet-dependent heme synthase
VDLLFAIPGVYKNRVRMIAARTAERTWEWLCELSARAPFWVETAAAPQFHRTLLRRTRLDAVRRRPFPSDTAPRRSRRSGLNDGNGMLFIDHIGNICPSQLLRLRAGHVRTQHIDEVYQTARVFRDLRDRSLLEGRCGECQFSELCGGSRARAFVTTGSYLASDPLCALWRLLRR